MNKRISVKIQRRRKKEIHIPTNIIQYLMRNVNVLRTATINALSCINRTIHIWCDLQTVPLTSEPMAIYAFACLHTGIERERVRKDQTHLDGMVFIAVAGRFKFSTAYICVISQLTSHNRIFLLRKFIKPVHDARLSLHHFTDFLFKRKRLLNVTKEMPLHPAI